MVRRLVLLSSLMIPTSSSSGALSNSLAGTIQFGRVPLPSSHDPSAGPNSPHYEIIFGVGTQTLTQVT